MRAQRHPGKLGATQKRAKKDIKNDEAAVDAAVDQVGFAEMAFFICAFACIMCVYI